ncbi:hypothetical protein N4T20_16240 [Flavobacterium sp. TR2]|uniref:hypothetical protein n=1 Tax=Flavobacterium sp. TR2 TaxID=2977321 RepID=UPI0021B10D0F|nr:hypothetical protein [Flavobacterium sp. TR2]UWY27272.1 hypothetical protein N4T20_16240 [Flavobacterium sp. TR2]
MENRKDKVPPVFEPVTSIPLTFINYSLGILFMLPILLLFASIFAFVYEGNIEAALSVSVFAFIIIVLFVVYIIGKRKKAYTTILINHNGIQYFNKFNGKLMKEIAWDNFVKGKENFNEAVGIKYDITTVLPRKAFYSYFNFEVLVGKEAIIQKEFFHGSHIFYLLYANRLKLIRAFLLGIKHFRPDLRVDPKAFRDHYINPESFEIDFKQRNLLVFFAFLVLIAILIGICYFV